MTDLVAGPRHETPEQWSSNTLSVCGIVFGALALVPFVTMVFGPAGLVCAAFARSKQERLSAVSLAVAIAGPLLGPALFFFVALPVKGMTDVGQGPLWGG